uniref:Uncharacterized protein n=1 Tax=Populus alba TaxID=43335 RepID=A0A4U5P4H0_POPAL|nr:uncharacterized protein D5086_0000225630 [Populus alba]
MVEVVDCSSARDAWLALEASFSHSSKTREIQLKDELQLMQRDYKIFSTSILSQFPMPSFANLIPQALSHELFSRSLHGDLSSLSAFVAHRGSSFSDVSGRPKSAISSSVSGNFSRSSVVTCGTDYITFDDSFDPSLSSDTSTSSVIPAHRLASTSCVPCADSHIPSPPSEDFLPPSSSVPSSSVIALDIIPPASSSSRPSPTINHPMVTRARMIINLFGQSIRTVECVPANPQVNSQQSATFWL